MEKNGYIVQVNNSAPYNIFGDKNLFCSTVSVEIDPTFIKKPED